MKNKNVLTEREQFLNDNPYFTETFISVKVFENDEMNRFGFSIINFDYLNF